MTAARDDFGAYRFDGFLLDPARGAVLGPGEAELRLRPKAFALLRHLLDNPGRLFGREELLDTLWPGVAVTDDSLTQCVSELRRAFGDRAAHVLRTVPKRGYVLDAEVRRDAPPRRETPPPAEALRPAPPASTTAARDAAAFREDPVAVHRFAAPDGERACVLLAEVLATDLIAAGTRIEGISVRPAADDALQEGYRITGEVRALGAGLRATVRLEDAATGAAFWAERLDRPRDGPPGLPEAALLALAAQLNRQVARRSLAAARRKPLEALTAREFTLVGRDHHQRGTEADTMLAKEMFARAIAADPEYGQAYAWQAYTVHRAITHGWGAPRAQEARDEALRLARRAVQLQPDSPLCLSRLSFALVLHQRWDEAVDAARAALASDRPAFAFTRNTSCEVLAAAGHPEEAAAIAEGTLALEPFPPPATHALLGRALLLAGRAEEALPPLRRCASQLPDYAPAHDSLVVAAVETGRLAEARAARRELLRLQPGWEPQNHAGLWFFRLPEDLDRFRAAHRRAAEPAGDADGWPADPAAAGLLASETGSAPSPPEFPPPDPRPADAQGLAASRREMLVVHPLRAASGDAGATRAAAAVASGLTEELVRYEDLRVVAGADGGRAARAFAVSGDVHSDGEMLCAHLRLEDRAAGTTIWAQRVEWPAGRAAGPPGEALAALAAAMDLRIGRRSLGRAREKPAEELSARELALLGGERYHRSTEADTTAAARMFARAAAIDPGYARAYAGQAFTVARAVMHGWKGQEHRDMVEQAVRLARRAVELEPESPLSLASLSVSFALGDRWAEAVAAARLALGSGHVAGNRARTAAGDVLIAAGHPVEGEEAVRRVVAQDPHCSPFVRMILGRALLLGGRPEEAMGELRRCAAQLPDYAMCFRTMVVAAVEAGLVEDAREAFRQVARLRPDWAGGAEPIFWFLRRREDQERYQGAFEMAMRLDAAAKAGGLAEAAVSRA